MKQKKYFEYFKLQQIVFYKMNNEYYTSATSCYLNVVQNNDMSADIFILKFSYGMHSSVIMKVIYKDKAWKI